MQRRTSLTREVPIDGHKCGFGETRLMSCSQVAAVAVEKQRRKQKALRRPTQLLEDPCEELSSLHDRVRLQI